MKVAFSLGVIVFVLLGCCRHDVASAGEIPALPPLATRPSTAPVAAVWYEISYPPPPKPGEELVPRRLIVAVWPDGTVIWSDNRATGGKPYYIGRIPNELVTKLLASLKEVGLFDLPGGARFGPDASYTVIAADADGKRQWLGSWHDPPTTRPRVHVGEGGMSALAPAQPRPKHSPEYARFLEVWSESRRLIESVVPERHGKLLNEKLDDRVFDVGRERRK